ncbi:hypothetical protein H5395_18240 [Paracoccus sp. MC1854]|nr:hypothetical protein [Paracoccus sp. MC1854]MBB1493371.1 hypothetical protein [Paracoccus sp. MC1854]
MLKDLRAFVGPSDSLLAEMLKTLTLSHVAYVPWCQPCQFVGGEVLA